MKIPNDKLMSAILETGRTRYIVIKHDDDGFEVSVMQQVALVHMAGPRELACAYRDTLNEALQGCIEQLKGLEHGAT